MDFAPCLHHLFEAQARVTPEAVAVEFHGQSLTYRELDERSTKLANYLRRLGVRVESLVGVCLERSPELLVALLGIMKAGAAYIPLDPGFPADRLAYMLEHSAAALLLTCRSLAGQFAHYPGTLLELEKSAEAIAAEPGIPRPSGVLPENLVYVIYTSGSTGTPKGVMIPHRAVVNFLQSMREEPGLTRHDSVLAITTFSFDIAVLELFLPLIAGARVIMADRETAIDGRKLVAELALRQPSVMQATPSTWRMLIASGWEGDKRLKALCGGEAMSRDLADELSERVASLWNMYGPTETTVWSLIARIQTGPGTVPIGRPIANTTVHILDGNGKPAPAGTSGNLYIGGRGLARGYKNRPVLTNEKFVASPLPDGGEEQIYDTGDLACYLADGQVEWQGRTDSQLKIRGHRIEPGEIESVLRRHQDVRDALVVMREEAEDDKRLVAYIVPAHPGITSASEIRQHTGKLLPDYMMPSAFIFLEALPMTLNGKLDRSAISDAKVVAPRPSQRETIKPQSELEATILRIFEQLLIVSTVCVTDNFFEMGGNSLLAVQLVIRIANETGHSIPMATLLQAPTARKLAMNLQDRTYTESWSPLVELRKGSSSAEPLFCIHWLDAKLVTFHKIASLLRDDRPVYGLQPGSPNGPDDPPHTIRDMAEVYLREIRAVCPDGPYHLAGSCLGGVVAFEIAQQLSAAGEEVKLLLMIDAFMPGLPRYLHKRRNALEHLDGYLGEFLLAPGAACKRWIRESVLRIGGRIRRDIPALRAANRLRKMINSAEATYQPVSYSGKVTLLICSDGPFRAYEDRRLAWSSVAEGGLEVHVVPGNHSTMEKEPNIRVIGELFQSCFDRLGSHQRSSRA